MPACGSVSRVARRCSWIFWARCWLAGLLSKCLAFVRYSACCGACFVLWRALFAASSVGYAPHTAVVWLLSPAVQVFRSPSGMVGVVDYASYDDMRYAVRKLDDTTFKNPFDKAVIRVDMDNEGGRDDRGASRSRSRSYSRSRSRSPAGNRRRER